MLRRSEEASRLAAEDKLRLAERELTREAACGGERALVLERIFAVEAAAEEERPRPRPRPGR